VTEVDAPTRPGKKGISRFVSVSAAPAPPPAVPPRPQGDLTRASVEESRRRCARPGRRSRPTTGGTEAAAPGTSCTT
jgi:hypothetical protein